MLEPDFKFKKAKRFYSDGARHFGRSTSTQCVDRLGDGVPDP